MTSLALAKETTNSGISIRLMRAGEVDGYPEPSQSVSVHYDAYLPNGKLWDSSRQRGKPLRFRLGMKQVISGLDEGVAQLSRGSRVRMSIPSSMAYGERGFPGLVPPNTDVEVCTLANLCHTCATCTDIRGPAPQFDIELLDIV